MYFYDMMYLEDSSSDQTLEKTHVRSQKVVGTAPPNLKKNEEDERHDESEQSGQPKRPCTH